VDSVRYRLLEVVSTRREHYMHLLTRITPNVGWFALFCAALAVVTIVRMAHQTWVYKKAGGEYVTDTSQFLMLGYHVFVLVFIAWKLLHGPVSSAIFIYTLLSFAVATFMRWTVKNNWCGDPGHQGLPEVGLHRRRALPGDQLMSATVPGGHPFFQESRVPTFGERIHSVT
jgi:hypothetical protein